MTSSTRPSDDEIRARALSRWENEGGALVSPGVPDSLDETEMRILARLGAATIEQWDRLPPALQGSVLHRARTLGAAGDRARAKKTLARFLREHGSDC